MHFAPLLLGRLPADTTLFGGHHFLMALGDAVVGDLPHAMRDNDESLQALLTERQTPVDLPDECVVLARYGHGTWGHWLGEILPIAAVLERAFPDRFRFAVPLHRSAYSEIIRQSLTAYGIGPERLIMLDQTNSHRLLNAWAMTPVWSNRAHHPAALDIMRGAVATGIYQPGMERIVLIRGESQTRGLMNRSEIMATLPGFVVADPTERSFADQVRLFQSATDIVGTIGSGLTGLIYSPENVRVVGLGPATWGDTFFYSIGQARNAIWAEARGRSRWNGEGLMRDAPFEVTPDALRQAMTSVGMRWCKEAFSSH